MLSILTALIVLTLVLGTRSFFRGRGSRERPIFQEHGIVAGRLVEGLLHALVSDHGFLRADTRVLGFEGSAIAIGRSGACGRLILFPVSGGRDDIAALRALAARHRSDRSATLIVVGGSEDYGTAALEATRPVRTIHIQDTGRLREVRRGLRPLAPRLVIESALDRMASELRDGAFPALDLEIARGLISPADSDPDPATRPGAVVISALTAAIILCFAAEVAISPDSFRGDGAVVSVAYRMGAIHQAAIRDGEWPRLLAAPFLHFGLLHLAMNGWAQWSLGVPLEFLMGSWRFLALWVGSALGASLTSFVFNATSISAGASGAIFGLLGAFTIFVFFRKDILPQPVPRSLRNGVLATLLLNLMISFIPSIDMAAHAGGFLTGALMGFFLVERGRKARPAPARGLGLRLAVALLVVGGVGVTSVQQRADLSVRAPEITTEYRVGEVSLPVPEAFSVSRSRVGGLSVVEADGDPASPFSITYKLSEPQVDDAAARRVLKTLRSEAGPARAGPNRDTGWIAISQLGLQDRRAIEVLVVAPTSCQKAAERLLTDLARRIH